MVSHEKVKKQQIHLFKSGIKVNSDETPGLEGAEFTLKLKSNVDEALDRGFTYEEIWGGVDRDGNIVSVNATRVSQAQEIAPTYEVLTTDKDGNAYTQKKLPYGRYICKETRTPVDYESAQDFTFSVTQDESEIHEISKKVKDIVVNDEQLETYIRLIKRDTKTGKNVSLNSATFQIYATEDIYDRATGLILHQRGYPIHQKLGGTIFDSFTTNSDNLIVPNNSFADRQQNKGTVIVPLKLEVGGYEIREITTPDGFLPLEKPIKFRVENVRNYDVDEDEDFIQEIVINNEQPTGELRIDKFIALRNGVDKSFVDTSDLSLIQFTLTAKENIIDKADGSIIYRAGQIIGVYTMDKNGYVKISDIPMGTYELQEIKTLPGLVLSREKYEVKFTKNDDVTKIYNELRKITNDTTLVEISKTDITGQDEIEGAKLSVIDESGTVIDSWVSTNRSHKLEGLKVGSTYTLREEIAPKGYVKANEITFTVKNTAEAQKVAMVDKYVDMSKVDIAGNEIVGAKLQVFDKANNLVDEWISEKTPHKIANLEENEEYRLHEQIAVNGYVKASDITFKVSDKKENQHIEMIDKIVELSKKDFGGEEVPGAEMYVTNSEGEIVDSWISGTTPHKISGLEENKIYTIHEKIAPKDYVKASDIYFKVTADKRTQYVNMIDKQVDMIKKDVDGNILEGATMQVLNKKGKVLDEWQTTTEPHYINNLTENQTYVLREKTAKEGYVKAKDIEFTVTKDKKTQHFEMIDKIFDFSKLDIGGNEVIGAEIVVKDTEDNIVDAWTSTDEIHKIKNLEEGKKYTLYEISAPTGFVKATEVIFEVTEEKVNQHLDLIDKVVEMTKLDVGGEEIEGAKIQVIDKDGKIVDEWTSTKEPHKISNLTEKETYVLHEDIAKDGYVKATDIIFTVTENKETQKVEMIDKIVDVSKTDITNGEEIEGAKLIVKDEDGNIVDEWQSTKEVHHVKGLEEGKKYTLTEITAPYGYEIAETIEFTVSFEKINEHIEMKDMPILKTIKIQKLDSSTNRSIINNYFEFGLYEDAECTKLIKKVSANTEDGTATFEDLRYGTYFLKEEKAPTNYQLSDKITKIEINDKGVFADEEILEENESVCSFNYYNTLIPRIQTGNETNYALLFAILGISIVAIIAGIFILRKCNE